MFQKDRSGHCIEKGLAEGQGLKPGVYSQAGIAAILAGDSCGVDHGERCRGARSGWSLNLIWRSMGEKEETRFLA